MNLGHVVGVLVVLAVALSSTCGPAAADQGSDVVVSVVNGTTGAPVSLARVFLQGENTTIGYTDADGRARFESVATGTYRASVAKRAYTTVRSSLFDVVASRATDVRVRIERTGTLKKIGAVSVSSTSARVSHEVGQDDALRFLDGSLREALGDLPGLTSSGEGYSIEGGDPSQTGTSIDGVPIPGVGGSLANRGINADLFGGASAGADAVNGSLAGNVDFRTLQPTRFPQQQATLRYASDASSSALLVGRGSLRNLGYVVEHAVRGRTSPLSGLNFTDQSGLAYVHDGDTSTAGDLVKLRWSPSLAQTTTLTASATNGQRGVVCTQQTALYPCGFGPGIFDHQRGTLATLSESTTIGSTSIFLAGFANASRDDLDARRGRFAGAPAPSTAETTTFTHGLSLSVQLPTGTRNALSLLATTYGLAADGEETNTLGTFPLRLRGAYRSARIVDRFRPTQRLGITANLGFNGGSGDASVVTRLDLDWQPARNVIYRVGGASGEVGAGLALGTSALPDPRSLSFDCGVGLALGSLPPTNAVRQRASSLRASAEFSGKHGRLSLTAWSRNLQGAPVLTALDGDALPLPSGYAAAVAAVATSPYVCSTAPVTSLAFTSYIPTDQRERGTTLSATLQSGTALLAAYATVQSRFVSAGSAAIATLTPAGAQVPGIPLHRAGVVFTTKLGRTVDFLANASYTGSNNASYLPGYTVVNAGFAVPVREGSLALVGTNLTNRYPGPFVSPGDARALPRLGAVPLPLAASPLGARAVALTYTIRTGRLGAGGSGAGTTATTAGESEGTAISLRLNELPAAPPPDALHIDPDNDNCTPRAAGLAQPVLDAVEVTRAAAERARSAGRYPATLPGAPSQINGVKLHYTVYDDGARYAVVVEAPIRSAGAFINCARMAIASKEDGPKRQLYFPAVQPAGEFFIAYAPSVGLYLVPPPEAMASNSKPIEPDPAPATAPAEPFAMRAACSAASKPIADALVRATRAARDAQRTGRSIPTTEVAAFTARGTPPASWLELRLRDTFATGAAIECLHVAAVTPGQLAAAGIVDTRRGGIGFADRFGFYLIVPAGGPAPGR